MTKLTTPSNKDRQRIFDPSDAKQLAERRKNERLAIASQAAPITNASSRGVYRGEELTAAPARRGAMDAATLPSMNNGRREAAKRPVSMCVGNGSLWLGR